ncbi:MAG: hypothetical protein ACKPKO_19735, partial [Candidatus Fonsibacter sp.]
DKPVSSALQTALDGQADKTNTYTTGDVDLNMSNLIASAPRSPKHTERGGSGVGERPEPRDDSI